MFLSGFELGNVAQFYWEINTNKTRKTNAQKFKSRWKIRLNFFIGIYCAPPDLRITTT